MKWILLFALSAGTAFGGPPMTTPEEHAIEVARAAAEPKLVRAYAQWAKLHGSPKRKMPKRETPWLKDLPPTSTSKTDSGNWLVVWHDEPPAGWFREANVSVDAKGIAKVLKARAGFASQ